MSCNKQGMTGMDHLGHDKFRQQNVASVSCRRKEPLPSPMVQPIHPGQVRANGSLTAGKSQL